MALNFNLNQAASSAPPAFGTTTSTSSFSFGGGGSVTQPTFGAPASTAPIAGISFGTPASTATAPLSTFGGAGAFGAPSAVTASTAGFGGFGVAASTAASLPNFGAATAPTSSLFGAPSTAAATTTSTAGFGFGGFGATSTAPAVQPSLGGGLFGNTSIANANTGGLFGNKPAFGAPASTAPASTAPTFTGLGGPAVTLASSAGGLGSDDQKQDKAVKDQELHSLLLPGIEEFKTFVKLQKNIASDITRSSCRPSERVDEDIEGIKQSLFGIRNHIQSYSSQAKKLKTESSKTLGHAEMAQQTQDIVPSMQDKHFAPDEYFIEIVNGIEEELKVISQEVDSVEKVVHSETESSTLKKEELVQSVKRLHEIFITVASKLQQVHSSVDQKKEQYLLLRQQLLHDSTDVFQNLQRSRQYPGAGSGGLSGGPSMFSNLQSTPNFASAVAAPAPALIRPTFTPNLSFGTLPTPAPVENTPFQLQQPPLGNKRGKQQ